ncbi:hypothetical protein MKX01_000284 [Papaver californicum]|nr:hypothetical protein MKX01_000284 [Papaver californicum]
MVDITQATMYDIPVIQACGLLCFPEEKSWDYVIYEFYIHSSPQLVYIAEDHGTKNNTPLVVARMEGEGTESHGYILSLGVFPTHRKLGVAKKLMIVVHNAMVQEYGSEYVFLHVCVSNHAAINLYTKILGYKDYGTAFRFCDDGEDFYVLRKQLQG